MSLTAKLGSSGKSYIYAPSLRAKAGEVSALERLSASDKDRIFPMFYIGQTMKPSFAPKLGAVWSGRGLSLDGQYHTEVTNSITAFFSLFHALGQFGVQVIPHVQVGAINPYLSAVTQVFGTYGVGAVVRVPLDQVGSAAAWISQLGWAPGDVDLAIDASHIADVSLGLMANMTTIVLQSTSLTAWRSVTLVASAAPKDAGSLSGGPNLIPRRDWELWRTVAPSAPVRLHFGDYGIAHRDPSEPPGIAMANATVTPRYALDNAWLIRKGSSTRGQNGQPMAVQYHAHAQAIGAHSSYGGLPTCWGDQEIQRYVSMAGVGGSGNRGSWVIIGLNRHMALVADRLP